MKYLFFIISFDDILKNIIILFYIKSFRFVFKQKNDPQ